MLALFYQKEITREGEGFPEKAFVQVIDGQFAKSDADTL